MFKGIFALGLSAGIGKFLNTDNIKFKYEIFRKESGCAHFSGLTVVQENDLACAIYGNITVSSHKYSLLTDMRRQQVDANKMQIAVKACILIIASILWVEITVFMLKSFIDRIFPKNSFRQHQSRRLKDLALSKLLPATAFWRYLNGPILNFLPQQICSCFPMQDTLNADTILDDFKVPLNLHIYLLWLY